MTITASRPVERVIASQAASAGTLPVRRALPEAGRRSVGPWVFLDHFGPVRVAAGDEGVGPHPHAGIETVTYLLEGRNEHRDSAGHEGIVTAGGAQWMTAGRGIVHAERPLPEGAGEVTQHGLQLWTSLPRALKMMPPRYRAIGADTIVVAQVPGATVRVVAGEVAGAKGPAETLMPLFLAHATVAPGAAASFGIAACHEAAAYVIAGEGGFGPEGGARAATGDLVVFADGGDALAARNTGSQPLELMLLGGAPAEGPLVFHGPFVMNSVEQARAAEVAFRAGRMGTLAPTS
ncbi:MAG: pirin family protein [Burkholderiales bacterium]